MKILLTTAAVALVATAAAAQYKTPPPPAQTPPTNRGAVQAQPNPNVLITPAQPDDELAKARRIDRQEAIKMVKAQKAVYVDVRSKESYDEGHVPGAISIPLSELTMRFKDLPLKKFIITYCA